MSSTNVLLFKLLPRELELFLGLQQRILSDLLKI